MDRRHFCKIASLTIAALTAGAAHASPPATDGKPLPSPTGMRKLRKACRLTVLRRECHLDLQAIYLDDPDAGPCRLFHAGDEMTFTAGAACPADFCPRLWEMMCATVGSDSCLDRRLPSTTILACPDGTRPVIIRIDEQA